MIIGENSREQDMEVNVTARRNLRTLRSSSADEAIPPHSAPRAQLEQAIEIHRRR